MTSNNLLYKSLFSHIGSHNSVSGVIYSGQNWSFSIYLWKKYPDLHRYDQKQCLLSIEICIFIFLDKMLKAMGTKLTVCLS